MHATEFLKSPQQINDVPVLVLSGSERFLKTEVLCHVPGVSDSDDHDCTLTRLSGDSTDLRSVTDELLTVSMFGDRRIVLVDSADLFVSTYRSGLETYAGKPCSGSMLILDVLKWPSNTRLYKAVEKVGLHVECSELKGAALQKWLIALCEHDHGKKLNRQAAELIIQLAGDSPGLLKQEIDKLAALVGDRTDVTEDDIVQVVGGWRVETTWKMLDAVQLGQISEALDYLQRLLKAGDAPQKILGGVTYTFRNLAIATEKARLTRDLNSALRSSGLHRGAISQAEQYLKRIGFSQASQIFQWLIEADVNMKGGSRVSPERQLEFLLIRLAGPKAA